MVEKSQLPGLWQAFQDPFRLLADPFRALGTRLAEWLAPAAEATSDEGAYRIAIELPGVAEKDIELTVDEGVVTVKGEKKSEREEQGDTWYFSERQYGAFSRSFRLPSDADAGAVKADLKDGVLTITVPRRAPAQPKARKVEIGKG
jgi:HSP20 family protein